MGAEKRECVGFRAVGGGDKRLSGFLCAAPGPRSGQTELGCLVDRLQLAPAGKSVGFDALLRGTPAPAAHGGCGAWVG